MAESWETLTHYRMVHEVAEIEGKRAAGRWIGADRN